MIDSHHFFHHVTYCKFQPMHSAVPHHNMWEATLESDCHPALASEHHCRTTTAEECKKKWKGLRDTLRKERRKEKERKRSGAEGGVARPWRYKEVMGFLNPFMEDRQTSSNVEGPESEEEGVVIE
ncbi:hypothetical protein ACEWY4_003832 [Coilia grayii]|uniref:MADF domain-containing protein n=1 Tax=Coilia grayii TaxID=363190 RepID=A0ABD1KSE5_9TELE